MKCRPFTIRVAIAAALLGAFALRAEEAQPKTAWDAKNLIPTKQCALCHKNANVGNQVAALEKGPHAKALETLKGEKAKEIGAKLGIADPSSSGKCLKCHSTAYGFTEEKVATVELAAGVECQSCHGPGALYKGKDKHAKDPAKAVAEWGMIKPTKENTCVRCHNAENPTNNPEAYTLKDGTKTNFDFDQAYEKMKHPKK